MTLGTSAWTSLGVDGTGSFCTTLGVAGTGALTLSLFNNTALTAGLWKRSLIFLLKKANLKVLTELDLLLAISKSIKNQISLVTASN